MSEPSKFDVQPAPRVDEERSSLQRAALLPSVARTSDVERAQWWAEGWYRLWCHEHFRLSNFGVGYYREKRAMKHLVKANDRWFVARREQQSDSSSQTAEAGALAAEVGGKAVAE